MNVAFRPTDPRWLGNEMFAAGSTCNVNGSCNRFIALKKFLAGKNIQLNTYDVYENRKSIDVWIIEELTPRSLLFILKNRIRPKRAILLMTEPVVVNPFGWKFLFLFSCLFKAILTWSPELTKKSRKYVRWFFPTTIRAEKYPHYRSNPKKNLALIMHSNKTSSVKGELYSLRREIISYFEKRGDHLLDVYGRGWNSEKSPHPFFTNLYKGTVSDKEEAYSQYSFAFCIDNCSVPGYITYDHFIAMATGAVPIYLPPPDADEFIPRNTYIDYRSFKNLDELCSFLQHLTPKEYENYRRAGWEFLTSAKFQPFTEESFVERVSSAILPSF